MNTPLANGSGDAAIAELYDSSIKTLPISARLQLAARILNDIPPQAVVDYQTEWSEQDQQDASAYSLWRAAASFDEDADA
jgi:hypothetical protein